MKFYKMAVAIDQHHGFKPFVRPPRCKLQSYSQLDYNMLDFNQNNLRDSLKHAIEFTNFHKSFSTPCLSVSTTLKEKIDNSPRIEIIGGHGSPRVRSLVVEVAIAMASGINPESVSSGLGGAYFLKGQSGATIAVAKPIDEEPLAFNNPKGFAGRMLGQPGMKRSIRVGETGLRELAAYLLDYGGFAGVPPTALVKISHAAFHVNHSESILAPPCKTASLQRFIDHNCDAGDLGPSSFSVNSIHRIGILDIRLLNLDRHAGNILVKQGQESNAVGAAELVPIDHGFCLPESLDDPYFEWLHWPQASVPFSEPELEYISTLDPFKDAELLRSEIPSINESSLRVLVVCTIFLKRASAFGLCLADIGEMMTREFYGGEEQCSALECLCINAKATLTSESNDENVSRDEDEESCEMFQFDDQFEDNSNEVPEFSQILKSSLVMGNPTKIRRFSSLNSISRLDDPIFLSLTEETNHKKSGSELNTNTIDVGKDDNAGGDNTKVGNLMRSMSFAAANHSNDFEGISFGELSDEDWESFVDIFEKLLPEAFEGRKNMSLSKQRLGSSCEF